MTQTIQLTRRPFGGQSPAATVALLIEEIQELYLADSVPWVIGYSGGKDSTAILQLVWMAIAGPARSTSAPSPSTSSPPTPSWRTRSSRPG